MAKVALSREAMREFDEALSYYERSSVSVAKRYAAEVNRILEQIGYQPDRYAWYDDVYREAILTKFPYCIAYRIEESGDVRVVAISLAYRERGYWEGRT